MQDAKKSPKIPVCAPSHNFVELYLRNRQSEKSAKQQCDVSSTCLHNMVNFGPLAAEIDWLVWGTPVTPAYFNGIAYWLRYCTDVAQRRSTKLYRMCGRLLGWYTIYTFWRLLPLTEFLAGRPSHWALAHILVKINSPASVPITTDF